MMSSLVIASILILLAWHAFPFVLLWRIPASEKRREGITPAVRMACAHSLCAAIPRSLFAMLVSLLAPLVVPVALIFTPRSADKLPRVFAWFDNDVSINGDDPRYWAADYAGTTYYANAHPRSFWARFVWLGLRNRASRLSQMLGHRWADPKGATTVYGLPGASKWQEGWNINEREGVFQLCYGKRLGRWAWEANVGHKVWRTADGRERANVVFIAFAPGKWGGKP